MNRLVLLAACAALFASTSAKGTSLTYMGALNGAQESPSVTTAGTGDVTLTIDDVADTLRLQTNWINLTSGTTVAHVHCCVVPGGAANAIPATATPTLPGFPTGVTSGSYDQTFSLTDASTYNPDFVAANGGTVEGARTALLNGLAQDEAYFNIHTEQNPAGEIRDFLIQCNTPVPEPHVLALLAAAAGAVFLRRKAL